MPFCLCLKINEIQHLLDALNNKAIMSFMFSNTLIYRLIILIIKIMITNHSTIKLSCSQNYTFVYAQITLNTKIKIFHK